MPAPIALTPRRAKPLVVHQLEVPRQQSLGGDETLRNAAVRLARLWGWWYWRVAGMGFPSSRFVLYDILSPETDSVGEN
jgi:hypothetical protein